MRSADLGLEEVMKSCVLVLTVLAALSFTGCGGGGMGSTTTTTPPTTYTISGTVTGQTGSLVVQNNLTDNVTVSATATTFSLGSVASGSAYSVTVLTPPAGQTCNVTAGTGTATANVSNIAIACTNTTTPSYNLGGTISGQTGSLVLQNNLADNVTVSATATTFSLGSVASGSAYSVTVLTPPAGQ